MECFVCQSCGLSFSIELGGTNKDGSVNSRFCKSCFVDGRFKNPQVTIQDLERRYLGRARRLRGITPEDAELAAKVLPDLDRWKMTHIL